jgi:hypothetical protein
LLSFSPAFCLLVLFWVFAIERILPVNMHNQQFCIAGLDYKVATWSCRWLIKWSLYVGGGAGYEFCNDFDLRKPAECSLFTGATIKCESLAGGVHMDSLLDHCKVFITNLAKVWFSIFTPNCQVGSLGWPSQIVYMGKNILVGFSCMFQNQQSLDFSILFVSLRGSIGTWYWGRPAGEVQLVGHLVFSLCVLHNACSPAQ